MDTTKSMKSVVEELKVALPSSSHSALPSALQISQQFFQFATASVVRFQDKPVAPFGESEDLCFNLITSLNNDIDLVESVAQSLDATGGGDVKDSQWDALYVGLLSIPLLPGTEEIFILVTDSEPHAAPEPSNEWASPPDEPGFYDCAGFAYPSVEHIVTALKARNPFARLLVLTSEEFIAFYSGELKDQVEETLVDVRSIGSDGEEFVDQVLSATNQLVCGTTKTTTTSTTPLVCAPESFDVQIFHLQDISDSFRRDLKTVKIQLNAAFEWLSDAFHTSEFALATFSDVAERPYGQPHVDHCYREVLSPFTRDPEEALDIVNALTTVSGLDWPEAQLHALKEAAQSPNVLWKHGAKSADGYWRLRVVVLATDAGFHVAGDRPRSEGGGGNCMGSDYPDIKTIAEVVRENDIRPVFLVTSDLKPVYESLLEQLGVDGAVVTLDNDVENLLEALQKGLEVVCGIETRKLLSQNRKFLARF